MGRHHWFSLEHRYNERSNREIARYEAVEVKPHGPAPACKKCESTTGMLRWNKPHVAKVFTTLGIFDFIVSDTGDDIIASSRFKAMCSEKNILGLTDWDEMKILLHTGKRILEIDSGYYYAKIEYGDMKVDPEKSGWDYKLDGEELCSECRGNRILNGHRSVVFENPDSESRDIVIPRGLGGAFCNSKFKNMCEDLGIANIEFRPSHMCKWLPYE